ncbi:MAG: hypothetical protein QOH50_5489, partial [Kribbellaceae bacterium]|nr:hypothetical protein [Kribbellaceae bacterium]
EDLLNIIHNNSTLLRQLAEQKDEGPIVQRDYLMDDVRMSAADDSDEEIEHTNIDVI